MMNHTVMQRKRIMTMILLSVKIWQILHHQQVAKKDWLQKTAWMVALIGNKYFGLVSSFRIVF